MIFIDTDTFVLDKLFPNDERHGINKTFLDETTGRFTSIFNLFELLGIASFNLNEVDIMKLFKGFGEAYDLEILYRSDRFHLGKRICRISF